MKVCIASLIIVSFSVASVQTLPKVCLPNAPIGLLLTDSALVIQRIEIKNDLIKSCLEKFIQEKALSNKLFGSGFGYITLSDTKRYPNSPVDATNNDAVQRWVSDTILSFRVGLSSKVLLDEAEPDAFLSDRYPAYYSVINDCPVLIYDEVVSIYFSTPCHLCYQSPFSLDSKRKLQEVINRRLKNVFDSNFEFVGLDGNLFLLDERDRGALSDKQILKKAAFTLNDEYNIYILRNGIFIKEKL